jgi:uncharacterized protein (TIGR02145 family)
MHAKSLAGPVFLFSMFIMIIACDKTTDPPQVSVPVLTTTGVTGITSTSATSGGNITSDGGSSITASGVCWSTNATPTINDNVTTDGIGSGSFNSTITGLTANTTYSVRAYATNSAGTGYGNVLAFTSTTANGNTVTDIDGNVYHTIIIGTQTWLVENLKSTKYRNGDSIPNILDNTTWDNLTTGAYCDYENNPINAATGRLYNWYAVNDGRNIAPLGWHVPSDGEWTTLINYLGGASVAGGKLKEAGTSHWTTPNQGATNSSGFTAIAVGFRFNDNDGLGLRYGGVNNHTKYWSVTQENTEKAWTRGLDFYLSAIQRDSYRMNNGYSVRCIKD